MGKGSHKRPMRITKEQYDANWEAAFIGDREEDRGVSGEVHEDRHEGDDVHTKDGASPETVTCPDCGIEIQPGVEVPFDRKNVCSNFGWPGPGEE